MFFGLLKVIVKLLIKYLSMYIMGLSEVDAVNEIERLQEYLLLVRRTVG